MRTLQRGLSACSTTSPQGDEGMHLFTLSQVREKGSRALLREFHTEFGDADRGASTPDRRRWEADW